MISGGQMSEEGQLSGHGARQGARMCRGTDVGSEQTKRNTPARVFAVFVWRW